MDDPFRVCKLNRPRDGGDQLRGFSIGERPARSELGEIRTTHQFQRQKQPAVEFAEVVDLHDAGMLQSRDGLGFGAKPLTIFWIAGMHVGQHLERDVTIQPDIFGLVYNGHSAASEFADDAVSLQVRCEGNRGFPCRIDARSRRQIQQQFPQRLPVFWKSSDVRVDRACFAADSQLHFERDQFAKQVATRNRGVCL